MDSRKLPPGSDKIEYIAGFLHDRTEDRTGGYGYHKNHLPETTGAAREVASCLDLVKR